MYRGGNNFCVLDTSTRSILCSHSGGCSEHAVYNCGHSFRVAYTNTALWVCSDAENSAIVATDCEALRAHLEMRR